MDLAVRLYSVLQVVSIGTVDLHAVAHLRLLFDLNGKDAFVMVTSEIIFL